MKLATYLGRLQRKPKAQAQQRIIASKGTPAVLIIVFLLLAALIGMVGGLGSMTLLMVIGGGTMATLLFFLVNSYGLLLSLFVMTFLIQGTLLYFMRMKAATWVAVGMALLFFFSILMKRVMSNSRRITSRPGSFGQSIILATGMYLLCFVASVVLNRPSTMQIVSGIKTSLPMFSVLLAFYWFHWEDMQVERLWKLMLVITLLQFPVVLYQHIFIAGAGNWDSVVGTFGGTPGFGGNSAIMVLFVITTMTYAVASWNAGVMNAKRMAFFVFVGVVVILLGEVKASFVWVPFTLFWVLRKRIMRNVFVMVGYCAVIAAFMAATWSVYAALYWGADADTGETVTEKFEARGGYFFDTTLIDYRTGEVSRAASLAIWTQDPQASAARRMLGYGPGASKPNGAFGAGSVARRYLPLHIDATGAAVLLWDVGIVGALSYVGMLVSAAWVSYRASKAANVTPQQKAILETCTPILIIMIMTLVYNRALVDEPTAQLLLMTILATIIQFARFGNFNWKRERSVKHHTLPPSKIVSI